MTSSDLLFDAILNGEQASIDDHVKRLLSYDVSAGDILNERCIPATQEARQRFEQGVFYLPDLFIALRSYLSALETLRPHIPTQTYQQALGYGEFDITCHL